MKTNVPIDYAKPLLYIYKYRNFLENEIFI